jgi:hypothetical protein
MWKVLNIEIGHLVSSHNMNKRILKASIWLKALEKYGIVGFLVKQYFDFVCINKRIFVASIDFWNS